MNSRALFLLAALGAAIVFGGGCSDGEEARFRPPTEPPPPLKGTAVVALDDGEGTATISRLDTWFPAFIERPEEVPENAKIVACRLVFEYATEDTNQAFFAVVTEASVDSLPVDIWGFPVVKSSPTCRVFPDQGGIGVYHLEADLPDGTQWPFWFHWLHLYDVRATGSGIGQECSGFAQVQVEGKVILLWIELDWEAAP